MPVVALKQVSPLGKIVVAARLDSVVASNHIAPMAARKMMAIGDKFVRLTVIGFASPRFSKSGREIERIVVRCDCGIEKIVGADKVRYFRTRSCGCLGIEASIKNLPKGHGHARHGRLTPTYISWRAMLDRCYRPTTNGYARYGGSGIVVCARWRASFENFLNDMGERPTGTTLDRRDSRGNYEPKNCKWSSWVEQEGNRSDTVHVFFGGVKIHLAEAARRLNVRPYNLYRWVRKNGDAQAVIDELLNASKGLASHA